MNLIDNPKQKLIASAEKRLKICEKIYDYFSGMKRITTDKQRSIFAEYKEEMQQVINEKAAALKELNNHIFQEPKENPLEKFCDAQEKEINDLKKLVESLQGRIIAMDKLAQMSDK